MESDISFLSPLLLVPVQLDHTGPDAPWKLSLYEEEVLTNHCLRELLLANFRLELPEAPEEGFEADGGRAAFQNAIADVVKEAESQSRWEVLDGAIMGTFSFQKLAMWQDLGKNRSRIASHDLCRAIAGDPTASISAGGDLPSPRDFDDRIHPKDTHTILDADSSQFEAILAAKAGMSLVLDGPPGTGKSQTIANIIGESLVSGKTVLFVSEKAAALAVVKRRLDACNLGDFCLECHSHKANKKEVIGELGRCLALPVEEYSDQSSALEKLRKERLKLNSYVRALHRKYGALKISAHLAHGRLARLKVQRASRCPIGKALDIDATTLAEIVERLNDLKASQTVICEHERHPWRGCRLTGVVLSLQEDIRQDFALLAESLVEATTAIEILKQYDLLSSIPGKDELIKSVGTLQKVLAFPHLPGSWFETNPRETASQIVERHLSQVQSQKLRQEEIASQTNEMQSLQVRCEALRQQLSAFRDEAILKTDERLLADISDRSSRGSTRLRALPPGTVKLLLTWLQERAEEIVAIRLLVRNTQIIVDEFSQLLGVRISQEFNLGLLSKLESLGEILRCIGPVNAGWSDQSTRERLKQVAIECQKDMATASAHQEGLCKTLGPDAFGVKGESLANLAVQFESTWRRVWSRITREWGRFVRSCESLYLQKLPRRARDLFADLRRLREYHELIRNVRNEEIANAAAAERERHSIPKGGRRS